MSLAFPSPITDDVPATTYKIVAIIQKGKGTQPTQKDATTTLVVKEFNYSWVIEEVLEEMKHALMVKDVIEKISDATCFGIKKNEEKLKAPHLEDIHLTIHVTTEAKKQNILEKTVNRKEIVLEMIR
ncbi:hypothetical protein L1987_48463 [Smallanthus sonchifolius]|uniref:Uncharacterized protein n=1 Tax=Smallanthus sonchifolius TaxID=185202 RepID=A0ACB9FRP7_9ASTR|nr:hypothetical protein L1987_48463 [Smallanthus sonchifolius]